MESYQKTKATADTSLYKEAAWKLGQKKEKTETFAEHWTLSKVFKPNPRKITREEENRLFSGNIIPVTRDISTSPFIE